MTAAPLNPPEAAEPEWAARERTKLLDGTYRAVPWSDTDWWHDLTTDGAPCAQHFTHVSEDDPTQIAFTPDAAKGAAGRKTRIKPGRYLARFAPQLHPDTIRAWVGKMTPPALVFASTADEWERVYTEGPSSCMSESADHYRGGQHPVRAYAGPDLQLAYTTTDDGRITARAIVWPERKAHSRIYGDVSRIAPLLETAGFERGSLEGARLRRIPVGRDGRAFLCPYLDWHSLLRDDGKWLVIDDAGDINGARTDGVTEECGEECAECGGRFREDDLCWYDAVDGMLCEECAGEILRTCGECETTVHRDRSTYVDRYERDVCARCAERTYPACDRCDLPTHTDDLVAGAGDATVCDSCAETHYHPCAGPGDGDGECTDGTLVANDDDDPLCAVCAGVVLRGTGAVSGVLPVRTSTAAGWVVLRCWLTSIPGIVVTHSDDRYRVTHEGSGLSLGITARTLPEAQLRASMLADAGVDWTLPAAVLTCAVVATAVHRAVAEANTLAG